MKNNRMEESMSYGQLRAGGSLRPEREERRGLSSGLRKSKSTINHFHRRLIYCHGRAGLWLCDSAICDCKWDSKENKHFKRARQKLLLFAMAALHCGVSEDIEVIKGNCNDDISLPCKATNRTKTYRYIMWYKTEKLPIIKRKNNNYTHYNFTSISLRDKETLVLHKVQPSDSGKYRCYLAAEVGGQNDESFIELNISECVSTVYPITTIPATADPCPAVEELTVPWAVIGLSLISVAKIILCIVTVEVCDRVIFRTVRRKQDVSGSKTGRSSWKD
ncbi:Protein sidekick-1 [Labeo rohita]|uniref:Protein sidekick-1 n=1 Tax=Labeo rohita TaxID=84645 RepID=A0ABQ8MH21_LABRO|nr:Protein sidekick-1 [Labeo rohita]